MVSIYHSRAHPQIEPELRAGPQHRAQPKRRIRADAALFADDPLDARARNPGGLGHLAQREPEGCEKFLAQHLARMPRRQRFGDLDHFAYLAPPKRTLRFAIIHSRIYSE